MNTSPSPFYTRAQPLGKKRKADDAAGATEAGFAPYLRTKWQIDQLNPTIHHEITHIN